MRRIPTHAIPNSVMTLATFKTTSAHTPHNAAIFFSVFKKTGKTINKFRHF